MKVLRVGCKLVPKRRAGVSSQCSCLASVALTARSRQVVDLAWVHILNPRKRFTTIVEIQSSKIDRTLVVCGEFDRVDQVLNAKELGLVHKQVVQQAYACSYKLCQVVGSLGIECAPRMGCEFGAVQVMRDHCDASSLAVFRCFDQRVRLACTHGSHEHVASGLLCAVVGTVEHCME